MSNRIPREKAVFCEALEIADPEQCRQFLEDLLPGRIKEKNLAKAG